MTLNSPTFLFLFLPVFLILYFAGPARSRNFFLLLFSLFFFIWSDLLYAPLIFGLVLINYFLLRGIQGNPAGPAHSPKRSRLLVIGITVNLASLIFFKLFIAYWLPLLDAASASGMHLPSWFASLLPRAAHFPLSLSFLTLQAISMLVDATRQDHIQPSRLLPVSAFLLMFPKAISGPLTRFREIAAQLKARELSLPQAAAGLRRFMLGFAKKALIADQLALITNREIFSTAPLNLSAGLAWLAILSYTLQIYFDFSAYSDMAIGLGQALGFNFGENFNYPYLSQSITDFWRRWHITLSNWFRDYIFYPLERKRRSGQHPDRWFGQSLNILVVFLLTGLWHGFTLPFIAWGLLHGAALALERGPFGAWLKKLWRPFQHVYTLTVIVLGWVFFRSPNLQFAWNFLKALAGFSKPSVWLPFSVYPPVSPLVWSALAAGILFSFPVLPALQKRFFSSLSSKGTAVLAWGRNVLAFGLFIAGILIQTGANYLPFIYGEF